MLEVDLVDCLLHRPPVLGGGQFGHVVDPFDPILELLLDLRAEPEQYARHGPSFPAAAATEYCLLSRTESPPQKRGAGRFVTSFDPPNPTIEGPLRAWRSPGRE